MPRYAKRSPDGVILFCDALSPMPVKRKDPEVTLPVKMTMPLFEKLADLEDAEEAGGTEATIIQRNRFRELVAEIARDNLVRYKADNGIVMRLYRADYENLAMRFMLRRKHGLLDESAWDAVISAYLKSPEFEDVRSRDD